MLPDFLKIHKALAPKGVTRSLLWSEYSAEAQASGKKFHVTTQFGNLYHA